MTTSVANEQQEPNYIEGVTAICTMNSQDFLEIRKIVSPQHQQAKVLTKRETLFKRDLIEVFVIVV